ncbi:MAG TPA: OmpA family protein [Vicinamibacteria bacterium]|nr:OmpA family protein [Vicinamibacteria bacterium]
MLRSHRPLAIALAFLLGAARFVLGQESTQLAEQQEQQEEGTYETVPAQVTRWGDTGFFDIFSAYTLQRGTVSAAGFRDNIDRSPLDMDISNFIGTVAFGATDKLEVFGRLDVQRRIDTDALHGALNAPPPPPNYNDEPRVSKSWAAGFGDVWLGAKYNILSEYDEQAVGLAVRGFVKFAAADDEEGLGTGKASGGAHLVLGKNLGERVASSYYVGFQANGSPPDGETFDIGNAFQWGLGVSAPTDRAIRATAQVSGQSFSGADFQQDSPTDLLLGLTYQTERGFFVTAGWRTNFNFDQPDETASGFNVSIGYHPGTRGRYIPPPPPPANRPPTVEATANPPEVEEGADSTVTADGNDPDGDALTYSWRAPDGRITGSGPRVTWTAPTGTEGSFPVTATVDDGRGGTASDTVNIRVHRRVVEAIEFEDVQFLFDRFDLTDEARAILDRVAAQLRENANLNIEIEGHCCSIATEEYNLSLGARRADTVKTYLVRAGIPESRLTTISYGESRPAHDNSREVTRRLNRRAHLRVLLTAPND